MRIPHWIVALAALMALASPAGAQTQITTSDIRGVVFDASGGVIIE